MSWRGLVRVILNSVQPESEPLGAGRVVRVPAVEARIVLAGQTFAGVAPLLRPRLGVVHLLLRMRLAAGDEPGERLPPSVLPDGIVPQVEAPSDSVALTW